MARITITDLRAAVAEINQNLADAGRSVRFEERGRNGYQAVDEYNVNPDGTRNGSHCNRNIGSGSSREVIAYCWEAYRNIG